MGLFSTTFWTYNPLKISKKEKERRRPQRVNIFPHTNTSFFAFATMAQNRQGIEQLMEAERQAADLIATARLLKKQRKTQADQDALMEIDGYKQKKSQEFDMIAQAGAGGQDENIAALAADAKEVCTRLDSEFQANRDRTTDMLVKMVSNGLL